MSDVGQMYKSKIPSRYDAVYNPMEAQKLAAADWKCGKIERELYDSVIAACSRSLNKRKVKESFDRMSGLNALPESRLATREVGEVSPPVNIAAQRYGGGEYVSEVEVSGFPFTVRITAEGRTFIEAEDVSAIPVAAQKAAAQKARLIWWAENSKPQWGFK